MYDGCQQAVLAYYEERILNLKYRLFCSVGNEDALFCVASTHLLFNPKAGEVKLAQLAYLFAELHKLASKSGLCDTYMYIM